MFAADIVFDKDLPVARVFITMPLIPINQLRPDRYHRHINGRAL